MGSTQRWTNSNRDSTISESKYLLLSLCLGLLNGALLITAVVMGIKCATVKQGSDQVSHPAASELISKLEYFRGSHSDMIEAEEEAKTQLQKVLSNHTNLKMQLVHQKVINDGYQKHIDELQSERALLLSNMSALEDSCGQCLPGWVVFNSSCYLFEYYNTLNGQLTWKESRDDCIRRGGDLLVIDNPEEKKFVENTISMFRRYRDSGFWIGISFVRTEGAFLWLNNVTAYIQPIDRQWMSRYTSFCGAFRSSVFIQRCNERSGWICEMQQNQSVDVPSK